MYFLHTYILLIICFWVGSFNLAAAQEVETLMDALAKTKEDNQKVKLVLAFGELNNRLNPDTAVYFYDQVLPLCETEDKLGFKAELLQQKGVAIDFEGTKNPIPFFEASLQAFQSLNDTIGIARVLKNIGIHHYYRNRYDDALDYFFQAHALFEKKQSLSYLSKILNNIAILYRLQEKYPRSIEIYQQSLAIKQQLKDSVGIATTFMNMGGAFEHLGDLDQMEAHFNQALDWYTILERPDGIAFCHVAMGQAFLNLKEYDKAAVQFNSAIIYYKDKAHHRNYGYCLQGLGIIENYRKNYLQTIQLLEPKLATIRAAGRTDITESMLNSLAIAKKETGAFEKALSYLQEANIMNDSINKEKRIALSEEMQTKFDVVQKNKDLEIAALKLRQQTQQKRFFSFGLFLAFLSLLIGAYLYFQKNKNNQLLAQKNAIIHQSLAEKEILVKAIEDRVENNMQFISNLLLLQSEHLADASAITALKESENRVAAMSLLHHNLQQQGQQANIEIAPYLSQLIDNVLVAYKTDMAKISVAKNIDALLIDVDRAIPIGLIINELLSSILKVAINKDKVGSIAITFEEKNQKLFLEVTNLDDSSTAQKLPIRSFGLKLIDMLVNQLGATWNEMEDAGGRFSISMPK